MLKELERAEANLERASTLLRGQLSQEIMDMAQDLIAESLHLQATVIARVREHLKESLKESLN